MLKSSLLTTSPLTFAKRFLSSSKSNLQCFLTNSLLNTSTKLSTNLSNHSNVIIDQNSNNECISNHLNLNTLDEMFDDQNVPKNILIQRQKLRKKYLDLQNNENNDNNNNDNNNNDDDQNNNNNNDNNQSQQTNDNQPSSKNIAESIEAYNMTPNEMIRELNRFVIGQNEAKKAVAVSWRARWRRRKLSDDYRREVTPKNILMIGPTGCGKTEVARRLARLSDSPFVKVEATKFTEVGYVGKDVNTIIEDLVAHSAILVKQRKKKEIAQILSDSVDNILLNALMGKLSESELKPWKTRLNAGELDDMQVEIDVQKEHDFNSILRGSLRNNPFLVFTGGDSGHKMERKQYPIKKAREVLIEQELKKHFNENDEINQAIELAENDGIVFIDEIDKICGSRDSFRGGGERRVSQEGVQRDLLPLIEGTIINVPNFGKVNTDHILFICAGAFHDSKPRDLMPEFQGRLPVRVELKPLTNEDMLKILTETEYNLINQQIEMLKTEECDLEFSNDAIQLIADTAVQCNKNVENIGARRLVTVIEKIMEDINVIAAEKKDQKFVIDRKYITDHIGDIIEGEDLTKWIL